MAEEKGRSSEMVSGRHQRELFRSGYDGISGGLPQTVADVPEGKETYHKGLPENQTGETEKGKTGCIPAEQIRFQLWFLDDQVTHSKRELKIERSGCEWASTPTFHPNLFNLA